MSIGGTVNRILDDRRPESDFDIDDTSSSVTGHTGHLGSQSPDHARSRSGPRGAHNSAHPNPTENEQLTTKDRSIIEMKDL